MDILPDHLIGKICSLTDDDTIFNIGCSSKLNSKTMGKSKDAIMFHRDNEPTYGLNALQNALPQFNIVPYDIHNFDNSNIISSYIGENVENIQHKVHVSSPDTTKRFTTYYFNTDLLSNDLMTSVKVKGNITKLSFEFATKRSFIDNMTDGFLSVLPVDEFGYKEILNDFLPYVYFKLFPFSEIILRIQHIGDIDINMTFVNFSRHHNEIIANLTYRRSNILFTYAIIPEMLYTNLAYDTGNGFVSFQVYPRFISKGIIIVVKQNNSIIEKPQEVIKNVNIDLYDTKSPEMIAYSFKLNSKRLYCGSIKKTKFYNLNFQVNDNCLYIPLENINFNYVSNTLIKLSFYDIQHSSEGFIDVIYLSKNMIRTKNGFGSRYYW